ncbi:MAG: response regulator transcription factor [Ktedonobacteraceae bacterium]
MPLLRILIADDHPLVRSGLRALLMTTEDLEVVGEAATGEEAVTLAATLHPDVIVMDLRMPGINGIEATRRVVQANPHIHILVVTLFEDDDSVFAALRAGARGYILKDANEVEVLRAIQAVSSGGAIFSASIAQRLIDFFSGPRPSVQSLPFPDLTDREREILTLIAQGRSNSEIAQTLVISMKTVRNYISSIFSKLQVADRSQAIIRAREAGLG